MPILTQGPKPGGITGTLPAFAGLSVQVTAPAGTDTKGIPPGGAVIGWALVTDANAAGGTRIDPAFLADGRTWTPDQYRAAYGQQLGIAVRG